MIWFLCSLQRRHNGRDGISNYQPHHCFLIPLFRCKSKKTSKLRVTGLYVGNLPVTSEFAAQKSGNAENVSIWWRHHLFRRHRTLDRATPSLELHIDISGQCLKHTLNIPHEVWKSGYIIRERWSALQITLLNNHTRKVTGGIKILIKDRVGTKKDWKQNTDNHSCW